MWVRGQHRKLRPASIDYQLTEGQGSITVGDKLRAVMASYKSQYSTTTTLRDSIFSVVHRGH